MLWIAFIVLVAMWLLGLITAFTLGGFIHLLLVIAMTILLIQLLQRPQHSRGQRHNRPHQL